MRRWLRRLRRGVGLPGITMTLPGFIGQVTPSPDGFTVTGTREPPVTMSDEDLRCLSGAVSRDSFDAYLRGDPEKSRRNARILEEAARRLGYSARGRLCDRCAQEIEEPGDGDEQPAA